MTTRTISAREFRQRCLAMLDEVANTGTGFIVTKRERPVARLVPLTDTATRDAAVLARLRGRGGYTADDEELLRPSSSWTR